MYNKIFNNKITNVECIFKKYIHNHPVSKLEKIIQKMNEKKLIIPCRCIHDSIIIILTKLEQKSVSPYQMHLSS